MGAMIELNGHDFERIAKEGIRTVAADLAVTPRELNEEIKRACREAGEALRALYRAMREGEEWKD